MNSATKTAAAIRHTILVSTGQIEASERDLIASCKARGLDVSQFDAVVDSLLDEGRIISSLMTTFREESGRVVGKMLVPALRAPDAKFYA